MRRTPKTVSNRVATTSRKWFTAFAPMRRDPSVNAKMLNDQQTVVARATKMPTTDVNYE